MKKIEKNESGHTIVEATIVYPVTILVFFVLLYASLFLCQRANLQANLEDALIYYKHVNSDTYVTAGSELSFEANGEEIFAVGNQYESPKKLDPYRHIFHTLTGGNLSSSNFASFFRSAYGHMFFDDGSNVQVTLKENDYLIYRKLTATAKQTVESPINISFVGATNTVDITAQATVVVVDGDNMIRDIDFAGDILEDTRLGKAASGVAEKAVGFYNKFKEKFGI